jgi:hypothetical protein
MIIKNDYNNITKIFDVLIVGSGPAGISLALKLEKKNINSCLIEAGDRYYSKESQNYYKGETNDEFPVKLDEVRQRHFGGTGGIWGGTCKTLDSYDFEKWPIKKTSIDPFLLEACDILEINPDFKEKELSSDIKLVEFQASKVRFDEKYYDHISNSKHIHLILNSTAILLSQKNNKIESINFFLENQSNIFSVKAKIFVLATGGIENSRILLIHNQKNLINNPIRDLPVGKYWFDHPAKFSGTAILNKAFTNKLIQNNFNKLQYGYGTSKDSITLSFSPSVDFIKKKEIFNSCIFVTFDFRENKNLRDKLINLSCFAPNLAKEFFKLYKLNLLCDAIIHSTWEQETKFYNQISLSNLSKDNYGFPRVEIKNKYSSLTYQTIKLSMENLGKYFIQNEAGRIQLENFILNENDFYKKPNEGGHHHMGGTIMGNDISKSVVDSNLKVHNVLNLYVAGSSVFPTGGYANPTLSIIQLSLRLGNHLSTIL